MSKVRHRTSTRRKSGYLFSYGTLQPKQAPPEIASTVRQFRAVGRGSVRGRLYDLGEYPGAVLTKRGTHVRGYVFELPDDPDVLNRLDEYEGFDQSHPRGSLFVRRKCLVTLEDGSRLRCWIYTYNQPLGPAPVMGGQDHSKMRNHRVR
ncbi:MAG TPA: gamma-glutamylcyclotransferase family protein [Terriglobales bacterium]|nr:gamma-glutamylcyclotransferase family protein [Terriglobales bacterium]